MIKMRWLPVLLIPVLTLAAGGVAAAEEARPPQLQPQLQVQPEAAPAVLDLAELLLGEAPLMSVEPRASETAAAGTPFPDTGWPYRGICWTSCYPCSSNADCPWGESCRFGVDCP